MSNKFDLINAGAIVILLINAGYVCGSEKNNTPSLSEKNYNTRTTDHRIEYLQDLVQTAKERLVPFCEVTARVTGESVSNASEAKQIKDRVEVENLLVEPDGNRAAYCAFCAIVWFYCDIVEDGSALIKELGGEISTELEASESGILRFGEDGKLENLGEIISQEGDFIKRVNIPLTVAISTDNFRRIFEGQPSVRDIFSEFRNGISFVQMIVRDSLDDYFNYYNSPDRIRG